MSRLITREDTKKMVRSLPKKVSRKQAEEFFAQGLMYDNPDEKFMWVSTSREDDSGHLLVDLKIPMTAAYKKGMMSFNRKNLGELGELFYQAINGSEFAKMLEVEKKYSKEVSRLNNQLKYIKLQNTPFPGGLVLYATRERGSHNFNNLPKKEGFDGGEGKELGNHLESYINKQSGNIKGLVNDSYTAELNPSKGKYGSVMNIWVEIYNLDGFKEWNKFIQAVKSFDRYLDAEE